MTIKTDGFVSLSSIQRTSTLREALVLCCQIDVAEKQIKTVGDSTFGRLRLEAVTVWNLMLEGVGGDAEKLDLEAVRGAFEAALAVEEDWIRSDDCPFAYDEGKLPRKWIESKSQIGIAISNGFNFTNDPEVGMSALRKFNKDVKTEAEKAAAQERAKKAAAAGHSPSLASDNTGKPTEDGTAVPGDAGDLPAGVEGDQPAAPNPSAKIPVGGTALSEEQLALMVDLMDKVNKIASVKGNAAVEGILNSFKNQVEGKYKSIGPALEQMAKAG